MTATPCSNASPSSEHDYAFGPIVDGCEVERAPLSEVEDTILRWSSRLAAASCTWLRVIATFDRRQGWAGLGISSCAHWLALHCGLDLRTAREQLATAHALEKLPAISAAFALGELSYSKVRAITRIATSGNETEWLDHARRMTAGKLERLASRRRQQAADPGKLRAARTLKVRSTPDGMVRIVATLAPDDAAILLGALDAAGVSLETGQDTPPAPAGPPSDGEIVHAPRGQVRDADALIALAEAFLHHGAPALQDSPHNLTCHIIAPGPELESEPGDQEVPQNISPGGPRAAKHTKDRPHGRFPAGIASALGSSIGLPAGMVSRLGCDALIRALITDSKGNPLHLGRRNRQPTSRLRDAVYARDQGTCQFPSCEHTRWLQIHHCREWHADEGETDIEVLLLVCGSHHRAVHDLGLTLSRDHDGLVTVRAPDGRMLPSAPAPTEQPASASSRYGLTA
ncbi:HNH endonuclease signature motif containing protein [Frankia sp. R82]|uniref:HNH endonuclease n=1 Tax=Frankia sp. R82 TaxID=2950553 RepID=UPI0020434BD8|nr:HNH endonuclease signature motif containing protein [Frankia sp. R82]MCM3882638.1 HNH endonuclease [Frankia sp. R82]